MLLWLCIIPSFFKNLKEALKGDLKMGKSKLLVSALVLSCVASSASAVLAPYPGTVGGRDYNFPGLGWLGHVGVSGFNVMARGNMGIQSGYIWEVLDNKNNPKWVIFHNKASKFIHTSKYWGYAAGLAHPQNVYGITNFAANQQSYGSSYTLVPDETRLGGVFGGKKTPGVFRCDTFVYKALQAGGIKLSISKITPSVVWNLFPRHSGGSKALAAHEDNSSEVYAKMEQIGAAAKESLEKIKSYIPSLSGEYKRQAIKSMALNHPTQEVLDEMIDKYYASSGEEKSYYADAIFLIDGYGKDLDFSSLKDFYLQEMNNNKDNSLKFVYGYLNNSRPREISPTVSDSIYKIIDKSDFPGYAMDLVSKSENQDELFSKAKDKMLDNEIIKDAAIIADGIPGAFGGETRNQLLSLASTKSLTDSEFDKSYKEKLVKALQG